MKEETDDPHRLARLVIRKRYTHQDGRTLHTHNRERLQWELMEELGDLASPISAFVKQKCHVDPDADIDKALLFLTWQKWCKAQGKHHPGDNVTFGRDLRSRANGSQRTAA